jgi:RNA polymerase sigma-70 factor (ECF subfamily)
VTDPAPDERILRDAVLRGDEGAWRVLYDRYFDAIHAYVDWNGRNAGERAEDLVQDSWMIAVRTIPRFDPSRSTFGAWLRGIAHNVIRNAARKGRGARGMVPLDESAAGLAPAVRATALGAPESVATALAALPETYREVLSAKYQDGLAVTEIAAASGRTAKAVESLLVRAREAFRRAYRPDPGDERSPSP